VAGALVNIAAALAGRVSVNLNFTAGKRGMESAARQAELRTVVTSALFVAKAELTLPEGVTPIFLEEVAEGIGGGSRVAGMLLALLAPVRALERACGAPRSSRPDDVATIIFSSGSTGEPKGVPLTHANVDANLRACLQIVPITDRDRLLGVLPFFHSFGYMATLWLVANIGVPAIYHPSPLDVTAIGDLVRRYRATIMFATPTFLQLYTRRITPGQFGSLRLVIAGAEKLRPAVADAFRDHFGIDPMEGYGVTETSPVVAVNVPDFRAPGLYQPGWRRGTVGQAVPGVSVRTVDPETYAVLPPGEEGMIIVRGPNVMAGYLGRPDLTAAAFHDGWYVTGDIGVFDEDGFLKITDRFSRFSKIGGEMVPHGVIEEALECSYGGDERAFAVSAVEDPRKGERIVVITTLEGQELSDVLERFGQRGLPNLFTPRRDDFLTVGEIPLLGSGKTDLGAVKRLADEHFAPRGTG
jgi:acyl-[acyl-carrier-protein]-phospholipid O-acyltransferase/long-chain-fatty-acid--[acyl-carrier-protein] ligase